jgi:hypothetical protein
MFDRLHGIGVIFAVALGTLAQLVLAAAAAACSNGGGFPG